MSLSSEEVFEVLIALLILAVAVVMVKITNIASLLPQTSLFLYSCGKFFCCKNVIIVDYYLILISLSPGQICASFGFSTQVSFQRNRLNDN